MKKLIKISSSDPEQDKSYALLSFLTSLLERQGSFTGPNNESVRISDHVFVVGGAVRNFVIGKPVKDLDIVIDAVRLSSDGVSRDAVWLSHLITKAAPKDVHITQVSNNFGVEILHINDDWIINGVNVKGEDIEIAFARNESYAQGGYKPDSVEKTTIEEDALRREFTFNTLMWSFAGLNDKGPSEGIVIDPLGTGLRDLKSNIIDTPLSPEVTFEDDASRIMRAMKFKFKYGFDLAPRVEDAIRENPDFIENVPTEVLYMLLTTTILNQDSYREALREMKDNLMLGKLIEILNKDEAFRISLSGWVRKERDFNYLFDLLDYGLPLDDKVSFLSDRDLSIFRENIKSMSKEEQDAYIMGLKNPGSLISDKTYFMTLYNKAKSISDMSIPEFRMDYYSPLFNEIILDKPELSSNPEVLKKMLEDSIMRKLKAPLSSESRAINSRLNKLALFLKDHQKISNNILSMKLANAPWADQILPMIPKAQGDVYVFDFDDTLFWTPEWFDQVSLDKDGTALGVSNKYPMIFGRAIGLVNSLNVNPEKYMRKERDGSLDDDILHQIKALLPMRLVKKITDIPALGKKNQTIFVLLDSSGREIPITKFKELFPSKTYKIFDMRAKYYHDAVIVSGDPNFYKIPETLGTVPNQKIIDIYKNKSSNAYVLTARETAPGINEGVSNRLASVGLPAPLKVFTRPAGMSGSEYKGRVIGELASQGSVTAITFYDDNQRYITGVKKILDEDYPEFANKVTLIHVSIKDKP